MAINKVIYGSDTLIDLTGDTVAPNKVLAGTTFHGANGSSATGSLVTRPVIDTTISDYADDLADASNGDLLIITDSNGAIGTNVINTTLADLDDAVAEVMEGDFLVTDNEQVAGTLDDEIAEIKTDIGDMSDLPTPTDSIAENIATLNTNLVAHFNYWIENGFLPDPSNPIIYLYNSDKGILAPNKTYTGSASGYTSKVEYFETYIRLWALNVTKAIWISANKYNVSVFKKLHIECSTTADNNNIDLKVGVVNVDNGYANDFSKAVSLQRNQTRQEIIVDLSDLQGEYFVKLMSSHTSSSSDCIIYVYKMWLSAD